MQQQMGRPGAVPGSGRVEGRVEDWRADLAVKATRASEAGVDDANPVTKRRPRVVNEEEDGGLGRRRPVRVISGGGRRRSGRWSSSHERDKARRGADDGSTVACSSTAASRWQRHREVREGGWGMDAGC
jgi:hypothetical protein